MDKRARLGENICEQCKNPFFGEVNKALCNKCMDKLFDKVKRYIRENKDATMHEIINETGATKKYIDKWILEGRLEFKSKAVEEEKDRLENLRKEFSRLNMGENKSLNNESNKSFRKSEHEFYRKREK